MFALNAFLETVPGALVDAGARARLLAAGDQLPDALTGQFGLEIRLGGDRRVDLAVLTATTRQLAVLGGTDPRIRLPRHLVGLPAWRTAARLANRSLDLAGAQSPLPTGVWLEFDMDRRPGPPLPGVFVGVLAASDGDPSLVPETVAEVLPSAAGLVDQLRRVQAAGLTIRQVGYFPHRQRTGIRLVTAAAPPVPQCRAALDRSGWPGPPAELERWLHTCAAWCDELHLALDLTPEGLGESIGVETFFTGLPQPPQEPRWRGLLDELVQSGLCTPDKRAALATPGGEYTAQLLTTRRYRRGLHHLKVVLRGDGTAAAKAYLGAREADS